MKTLRRQLTSLLSLPVPLLVVLVALLPFPVIYLIASGMSFILFHLVKYRKKIVILNLTNAFPEKQHSWIMQTAGKFYKHMGDITLEALKVFMASGATMKRRIHFSQQGEAVIGEFYKKKKSVIVVMGHYGNWEWIGPGFNLSFPDYLHTAYKPLKNYVINWLILKIRSRFGLVLVPSDKIARHLIDLDKNNQYKAFAMAADQAPSPGTAQWLTFLNQDTPFFTGPEKLARKFNMPVIFCSLRKQKRGHYLIHVEVITTTPLELSPGHITSEYARLLEAEIINAPQYWLWSHRRWKHRKSKK